MLKASPIVRQSTEVVAEHLFIEIAEQVKRFDAHVGSLQAALEQTPEILQPVCVDLPINIPFCVVNSLVNEILIVQSLIGQKRDLHRCAPVLSGIEQSRFR